MSDEPKLLVFAGSARRESYNKKLARQATEAVRRAGGQVTFIDLADFPMPIYDGDFEDEHGLPEPAGRFKKLMIEHDAFLIATPEYNSSFPPLLKNALDWASRSESEDEPTRMAYAGKVGAVMSASPGAFGGMRAVLQLRTLLTNIGVLVLPDAFSLPKADQAFDEQGRLKEPRRQQILEGFARDFVELARRNRRRA